MEKKQVVLPILWPQLHIKWVKYHFFNFILGKKKPEILSKIDYIENNRQKLSSHPELVILENRLLYSARLKKWKYAFSLKQSEVWYTIWFLSNTS